MPADLHFGIASPIGSVDNSGRKPQHPLLDLAERIEVDSVWLVGLVHGWSSTVRTSCRAR